MIVVSLIDEMLDVSSGLNRTGFNFWGEVSV